MPRRALDGGKPDHALVLMAKIAATEACQDVLRHASQAHGARGFLAEEVIGRLVRGRARADDRRRGDRSLDRGAVANRVAAVLAR